MRAGGELYVCVCVCVCVRARVCVCKRTWRYVVFPLPVHTQVRTHVHTHSPPCESVGRTRVQYTWTQGLHTKGCTASTGGLRWKAVEMLNAHRWGVGRPQCDLQPKSKFKLSPKRNISFSFCIIFHCFGHSFICCTTFLLYYTEY